MNPVFQIQFHWGFLAFLGLIFWILGAGIQEKRILAIISLVLAAFWTTWLGIAQTFLTVSWPLLPSFGLLILAVLLGIGVYLFSQQDKGFLTFFCSLGSGICFLLFGANFGANF